MLLPARPQMRPQLRRPPPAATDVLPALPPWFPLASAPSRPVSGAASTRGSELPPRHAAGPATDAKAHALAHLHPTRDADQSSQRLLSVAAPSWQPVQLTSGSRIMRSETETGIASATSQQEFE